MSAATEDAAVGARQAARDAAFEGMLDDGYQLMQHQEWDKPLVLVIGLTGAGKSTLLNVLLGNEMEPVKLSPIQTSLSVRMPARVRGPGIGHNTLKSETLYPTVYVPSEGELSLADTPGFSDTRGNDTQAVAALFTQYLIDRAADIRGVLVVLSEDTITANRGLGFTSLMDTVGVFLPHSQTHPCNLGFVVTKATISADEVKETIRHMLSQTPRTEGFESVISGMELMLRSPVSVFPKASMTATVEMPVLEFVAEWTTMDKSVLGRVAVERVVKHLSAILFRQIDVLNEQVRLIKGATIGLQEAVERVVSTEREVRDLERSLERAKQTNGRSLKQASALLEDVIRSKQLVLRRVDQDQVETDDLIVFMREQELPNLSSNQHEIFWNDVVKVKASQFKRGERPQCSFKFDAGVPFERYAFVKDKPKLANVEVEEVLVDPHRGFLELTVYSKKNMLGQFRSFEAHIQVYVARQNLPRNQEKRRFVLAEIAEHERRGQSLVEQRAAIAREIKDLEKHRLDMLRNNEFAEENRALLESKVAEKRAKTMDLGKVSQLADTIHSARDAIESNPKLPFFMDVLKRMGEGRERIAEIERVRDDALMKARKFYRPIEEVLDEARGQIADPSALSPEMDAATAFKVSREKPEAPGLTLIDLCRVLVRMCPSLRPKQVVELFNRLRDASDKTIHEREFAALWGAFQPGRSSSEIIGTLMG